LLRESKPPTLSFGLTPSEQAKKKYQQPVVTYFKDGKKVELHRYYKKVGSDETLDFDVTSTTLENNGKRPVVTHVVEVTRTDNTGRVTRSVHKYGDDLPWHAAASKWNSPAMIAPPPVVTLGSSRSVAAEAATGGSSTWGKGNPFVSQPLNWGELPSYYWTGDEREKVATSRSLAAALLTREHSLPAPRQIYSKFSTTTMAYGYWYVDPSMNVLPL
jgi:hypothetical protein